LPNTVVARYASGTWNRLPSIVYMAQWHFICDRRCCAACLVIYGWYLLTPLPLIHQLSKPLGMHHSHGWLFLVLMYFAQRCLVCEFIDEVMVSHEYIGTEIWDLLAVDKRQCTCNVGSEGRQPDSDQILLGHGLSVEAKVVD
jgi:hypothetical protein